MSINVHKIDIKDNHEHDDHDAHTNHHLHLHHHEHEDDDNFSEDVLISGDVNESKRSPLVNGFIFLGKAISSQWRILLSITFIFITIITVIALVTWGVDYLTVGGNFNITVDEAGNAEHISFFDALWWVFITISTIGYGDVYPITVAMKAWAMLVGIVGIVFVSLYTAVVVNGFAVEMQKNLEKRRERREAAHRKKATAGVVKELRHQLKVQAQEIDELMFALTKVSGKTQKEVEEALVEARLLARKKALDEANKKQASKIKKETHKKVSKAAKSTKTTSNTKTKSTNKKVNDKTEKDDVTE